MHYDDINKFSKNKKDNFNPNDLINDDIDATTNDLDDGDLK